MKLIKMVETAQNKVAVNRIIEYIGDSEERFAELVKIFLNGPYRLTQRAAWPLSYCVIRYPELAKPHLKPLIKNLEKDGIHDAVKRNTVRFLQFVEIPNALKGVTYNTCQNLLSNPKEPVAIRVFAMTVMANISREHPELKRELAALIEAQMPYGSAAFRSRGKKVLGVLLKM